MIVEREPSTLAELDLPVIVGDATDDAVLRAAGIERAASLVAAVDSDAANSFIALGARALGPELFIVARARSQDSGEKLLRAGADRVVNPQSIGGARMAAFVLRPHVAAFLDVVMHEETLEFRLEEIGIGADSPVAEQTIRDSEAPRPHGRAGARRPPRGRDVPHEPAPGHQPPPRRGADRDRHPGGARRALGVRPRLTHPTFPRARNRAIGPALRDLRP